MYQCKEEGCGYRCMFEGEMKDHVKTHSGQGLFKCSKKKCGKSYSSKRARNLHEKSHNSQDWTCAAEIDDDGTICGQDCVDKAHLEQHMRGFHGPGWDSRCGENFKWPSLKYKHEKECKKCIRLTKKARKKNPI